MAGNTITYDIDDTGIGVFDGLFNAQECDYYIQFWKMSKQANLTWHHQNGSITADDERADVVPPQALGHDITYNTGSFLDKLWNSIYPIYSKKFRLHSYNISVNNLKVQKTLPGGGYHSWHTENTLPNNQHRLWVAMMYLNDVLEGGETEFLAQKRRIEPRMGRVVMFPATYTHVHRGNPPLSGEKFILTCWGEYTFAPPIQ